MRSISVLGFGVSYIRDLTVYRAWMSNFISLYLAECNFLCIPRKIVIQVVGCLWLTHWGRVTHICVSDLTSIGSDNGLSPGRCQAIIRTNARILLIGPLGTNFSEFLVEILIFSFKKMHLKVSSAKRRPFCLGLNELRPGQYCRKDFD